MSTPHSHPHVLSAEPDNIVECFLTQARSRHDAVAVRCGRQTLTYGALSGRARRIFLRLQARGIGLESIVAVSMERSADLVCCLLGILMSGAAYLPIDMKWPVDHRAKVMRSVGARHLVTSLDSGNEFEGTGIEVHLFEHFGRTFDDLVEGCPRIHNGAMGLAYVMFTSGSTGEPKAVGVTHGNVVTLVIGTNYVRFGARDAVLQLAPITFDASTFELWVALLNGLTLVIYPGNFTDWRQLGQIIANEAVTIVWLTAGLFQRIVDEALPTLAPIRQLLAGGDVLSATHVKKVIQSFPDCSVINGYGPTECTTFSACYPIRNSRDVGDFIPIGFPPVGRSLHVLNHEMTEVPNGDLGELYIGGSGVSRGYLNSPTMTAVRFAANPFGDPGSRLYRTGDMVKRQWSGALDFVGRSDRQLKVRGYRIEPAGIEAVLTACAGVEQAVVVAVTDASDDKRLVAYLVGRSGNLPETDVLQAFVSSRLPSHERPSAFVALDAFPLTSNGKIDYRNLPQPDWHHNARRVIGGARTPLERRVEAAFASINGSQRLNVIEDLLSRGAMKDSVGTVLEGLYRGSLVQAPNVNEFTKISIADIVNDMRRRVKQQECSVMDTEQASQVPVENVVCSIWSDVLKTDDIKIDDDFFELGGTSLGMISVVSQMSERFGVPLDTAIVSKGATVASLASSVREALKNHRLSSAG